MIQRANILTGFFIATALLFVVAIPAAALRPVWPPGRADTQYAVVAQCDDPTCNTTWTIIRAANVVWVSRRTRLPVRTVRPVCPTCKGWGSVLSITEIEPDTLDVDH